MHRRWRPNMISAAALAQYEQGKAVTPVFKAT
jgi:KDO2-lipid IV(A) lauroyltransferase